MRARSSLKLAKRRLLQHLPGEVGRRYKAKAQSLRRSPEGNDEKLRQALIACAGKPAIDLGGNMGVYSRMMAEHASQVHVFEPDPWTAEQLAKNVSDLQNIHLHQKAAGAEAATLPIYRHRDFEADREAGSECSSLRADMRDVDASAAVAVVDVVDFVAFLDETFDQVGVIKIDIEGAELDLLPALFDSKAIEKVDYIFCETHEVHMLDKLAQFELLRKRAAKFTKPVIDLGWH